MRICFIFSKDMLDFKEAHILAGHKKRARAEVLSGSASSMVTLHGRRRSSQNVSSKGFKASKFLAYLACQRAIIPFLA